MIEPVNFILMLAADDNGGGEVLQIIIFAVIIAGSLISAYFKKSAEKRQQEKARQQADEAKEILARRAQREQVRQTPPPPPKPQPRPSMFAAPPKPVNVEEHRMVELASIDPLPPEDQLIHTTMPSSVHQQKASVGDLVRKQPQRTDGRIDRNLHELSKMTESNVHTRVNLIDPATARAAIIFQEILSPPKALRDKPEMWD